MKYSLMRCLVKFFWGLKDCVELLVDGVADLIDAGASSSALGITFMTNQGGKANARLRIQGMFFQRGSMGRVASMARINGSAKEGTCKASTQPPNVNPMMVSSVNERNA
jgi:hypothetical protein